MTTVLIADDHATVRSGLRLLLEAHGLDVVLPAQAGAQPAGEPALATAPAVDGRPVPGQPERGTE